MLKATDYKGKLLGEIDFISASWDRRWNEPGEFMVYMTLGEYNRLNALGMKYIENVGRPETGVIQKTEYSRDVRGAFVTVSGHFTEALLDFAVYRKTQVVSASTAAAVKSAISAYITNATAAVIVDGTAYKPLRSVTIDSASSFPNAVSASVDCDMQMGAALYAILSGTNYGLLTSVSEYPAEDSTGAVGLRVKFRAGVQRTEDEDGVFFGKAYNNVDDMTYTLDESAEYCLYEVLQEIESDVYGSFSSTYFPIKFTEVENGQTKYFIGCTYYYSGNRPTQLGDCYPKRVLKTALSSDECDLKNTTTTNQQKIKALMQKKAQLDMLDHYKVEAISVSVLQEKFIYLKDYDLGDVCVALIDDMEQFYTARIVEINETHKSNRIDVELVLGSPSKQKWRK